MSIRLALAELGLPPFIRRIGILRLFRLTAGAFGVPVPPIRTRRNARLLRDFAAFTRDEADRLAARPADVEGVRSVLRSQAVVMGVDLRRAFGVRDLGDGELLLGIVYRAIGVELHAEGGTVTVRRCAFAPFYDEGTCRLISSLDEGLMAGILGEGRLEFTERLTAGQGGCAGTYRLRKDIP